MPVQAKTNAFDTYLDKNYLSISISEDGHCVIQKQAKLIPRDATELIKKFACSCDSDHYVVRFLDTAVKNVKKALEKDEK
eukprot:9306840-Ditylum_brightwellii.AAC.1